MFFYIKLFFLVIFGSVAGWFAIQRLVISTDHMPDQFDISTTSYMDRDEEELVAEPTDIIVREKSELELEIEEERRAIIEAALERQKERDMDEENNALSTDTIPIDEEAAEEAAEGDEGEEGDEGDGDNNAENGGEPNRADSDADMDARGAIDGAEIIPDKLSLGDSREDDEFKKRTDTVQALDLAFAPPAESTCNISSNEVIRIGINYRNTSFAIKGHSLTNIDKLIQLYRKCGGGKMLILQNAEGLNDTKERLIQLRKDEVKYYLLRRLVPKDDMIFPDNS